MIKKWSSVLVERANQYLSEYDNKGVSSHLQDSLLYFDSLSERLLKSQEVKKFKKTYVNLAIYWTAVGDILDTENPELTGMEAFWSFSTQIGVLPEEVTTVSNIILSRRKGLLSDKVEAKIFQDVDTIADIGKHTWNRLLTFSADDIVVLNRLEEAGKSLNFQSSQELFEDELVSRLKHMYKYVQGLVTNGDEE